MSLSIMTAFGPGRPWLAGLWRESLDRIGLTPELTRLVVMDNTGDPATRRRIVEAIRARPWAQRVLLSEAHTVDRKRGGARAVADHLAGLCNRMAAATGDAEWVLSLEPDVAPPRGAAARLLAHVSPEEHGVAVIGCPIRSRQRGHVMVYLAKSLDPWRLDRTRKPDGSGIEDVDSVCMGFTLIRGDLLRGVRLAGSPNRDGSGGHGHEWSLMKQARLGGARVLCDWSVRPRHYRTPDRWVAA